MYQYNICYGFADMQTRKMTVNCGQKYLNMKLTEKLNNAKYWSFHIHGATNHWGG